MSITESHYSFEDVRFKTAIDEVSNSIVSILFTFLANLHLISTEPSAIFVENTQNIN